MQRTVQGAPARPARLNQNPKAVRRLRMIAGYRQKELAEAVGVSPNHLCNIECGRRSASVDTLHRLADALSRPVEELLAE